MFKSLNSGFFCFSSLDFFILLGTVDYMSLSLMLCCNCFSDSDPLSSPSLAIYCFPCTLIIHISQIPALGSFSVLYTYPFQVFIHARGSQLLPHESASSVLVSSPSPSVNLHCQSHLTSEFQHYRLSLIYSDCLWSTTAHIFNNHLKHGRILSLEMQLSGRGLAYHL